MMADSPQMRFESRPGFEPRRLVSLIRDAIDRCRLDLRERVVLTEAATGAYVVTPVIAAMAGAKKVFALAKETRYGTVNEIKKQTHSLARLAGIDGKIEIISEKTQDVVAEADIVTNSGHVRPIDAQTVGWMKPSAVVPLMYEAWELRDSDVNIDACRRHGIAVAGTNERHPAVDVFSFLGMMAIKLLTDAGVAVYRSRILLLCDNPFLPFVKAGLSSAGAAVYCVRSRSELENRRSRAETYDAILVALTPQSEPVVGPEASLLSASEIATEYPTAVVAQFWGDIDRRALADQQVPYWPLESVAVGHMGILPASIGPEPVIRLQVGGLKVGELLGRPMISQRAHPDDSYAQRL